MKKYLSIFIFILILAYSNTSSAVVATSTKAESKEEAKKERIKTSADKLLDQRIDSLNKLKDRLSEMKNLTDTDQSAINTLINNAITELNNVRTAIENATSSEATKEARESITKKYRIYALLMPQLNIIASSDRMTTMVSMLNVVAAKIESRLSSASSTASLGSTDINNANKALIDMKTKLADAQNNAQSAVTQASGLVADDGDKTVAESNLKALKEARSKIKSAQTSLVTAKKDAESIMKILGKEKVKEVKKETATSTAK